MSTPATNRFGAADATVGYLYQIRVALLLSLARLKQTTDFLVSIEVLDDVAFETDGQPAEIFQSKHHRSREANLTDASPDLWKSLRIWIEGLSTASIAAGSTLNLLTTSTAGEGSAASYLRRDNRDVAAATTALEATARTSKNKDNAELYSSFLSLSAQERLDLLSSIFVLDAAPDIGDVDHAIGVQLFWAVDRKHQEAFRQYLEGWWFRRAIMHLTTGITTDRIVAAEIEAQVADLREQFKQDALPIADDLLNIPPHERLFAEKAEALFVQQLQLAKAGEKRVLAAIRDYYRAFEQRSRWLRDDLLVVGDLTNYERRLVEEWQLVFEAMKDELGPTAADAAKEQAARKVLEWAERTIIPIRPRVTEPFVTRGSLHILADDLRVGWHLDFRERLAQLLRSAPTAA
jgi:hypothetical protein